jgi:hypothetical protein
MNPTLIPKEVLLQAEHVGTCKLQRAIVYNYNMGAQVKEDEMGRACVTYGVEK